jgi:acetolactate synthase-1/2/3 large subunit
MNNMQKVSNYIADFLHDAGLRHVFMLTGGGAMHLNDSFGNHTGLQKVYNHHEQASAMAADSYARLTRQVPIVNITTGPGGINTINGVFGAYVDSLPMLIVSGQVRYDTTVASTTLPLRQLGDQECAIVEMVKGITKYAVMVTDPKEIKYELQKALYLVTSGRPGPVWLDIPMNIQGASIDPDTLREFNPAELAAEVTPVVTDIQINDVLTRILAAKRPVILVGAGLRLSGMHAEFLTLIKTLGIPVTTAWNAHDALHDDHPLHCGKPGSIGDRAGNFTVQNADLLLVLGSRLNIRQISYNYDSFARHAYKIMVDVDAAELAKPTLKIDYPIHANLADFIPKLISAAKAHHPSPEHSAWVSWCKERKAKYPVVLPAYWDNKKNVNPYCFMQALSHALPENQIIVTGDGTACVVSFQAMHLKEGQRLFTNSGCASMGYDLPGAIGACVGSGGKSVICLAGDGSIMQNIQELATIAYNRYPIKIFILNNNGYHSIRQTQQNFFGEKLVGVGPDSGLGFPDFAKLAAGFDIPFVRCDNHDEMEACFKKVIAEDGPMICEAMIDLNQQFAPKLSSRRLEDGRMVTSPMEDMTPFLSREELAENMLVTEVAS